MANLKDIRRRIASVKSTQKITRAMKLVSAAKFARANTAVVASRPYGKAFDRMVARLVAAAGDDFESPLLTARPEKKTLVVLLATDRGFCGGLNSNLFKQALYFIAGKRKENVEIELMPLGRRARHFSGKLKYRAEGGREKVLERVTYDAAKELAKELTDRYLDEGFDRVYIGYVEFKSVLSQSPKFQQLLPVGRLGDPAAVAAEKEAGGGNVLVEPNASELLENLLKRAVASLIFRAMLEGSASEHGARMTAMDAATNNASEVLRRMSIQYNRARQAAITKELIEITSGAQAL
jgi:F-type H+-transporting ATPase subunit gamma